MSKDLKKEIKQLSNIQDEIIALIKKHNLLAKKIDFESRLGLMEASYCRDDFDDDDHKNQKINDLVEKECMETGVYILATPECDMWFPSSIGC